MLLHGTNSSRQVWAPLLPALTATRDVVAVDLPGHGASPAGAGGWTPPEFAVAVAALLDELGWERPAVAGHSVGGWTALELGVRRRAGAVLALVPAGLWRARSPLLTDVGLTVDWTLGRLAGPLAEPVLRRPRGRALALSKISAEPRAIPAQVAVAAARQGGATAGFPQHFRATRRLRFRGGAAIPATVPVRVVWAAQDRIALAGRSRHPDELPAHATVETWDRCGHMTMWDQPQRTAAAAAALTVPA